MNSEEY